MVHVIGYSIPKGNRALNLAGVEQMRKTDTKGDSEMKFNLATGLHRKSPFHDF